MKDQLLAIILYIIIISVANAITPTGEIKIRQSSDYVYVAPGGFGDDLPGETDTIYRKLVQPLGDNQDGCQAIETPVGKNVPFYVMLSRGNCSFYEKSKAAEEAGAKGVIIYNSLEGIYKGQDYADEMDYECDNGMGYIDELSYPVYSDEMVAKIPTSCSMDSNCASGRCVVTNVTDENGIKVCCAWDLYITMGSEDDDSVGIPSVFITMSDADTLMSNSEFSKSTMEILLFSRPDYAVDISSMLLWLLAVCTVGVGAAQSAEEDRVNYYSPKHVSSSSSLSTSTTSSSMDGIDETTPLTIDSSRSQTNSIRINNQTQSSSSSSSKQRPIKRKVYEDEDDGSMHITPCYAVMFVLISSAFLVLLYFVDLYSVVTVVYLCAAVLACTTIYFHPFFDSCYAKHCDCNGDGSSSGGSGRTSGGGTGGSGYKAMIENWVDIPLTMALVVSMVIAGTWYLESDSSWVWVLQDIMGVAVCITFLKIVKLPNLKVATILLGLAFIYDIFFVFISPYIFSSSVMIQVATGTSSEAVSEDENYCEKYPDADACESTTLPMLLVMPTFSSYVSSESLLGLGDIVLPGLLLVWTARYDIRRYGTLSSEQANKGYFPMALFGYAAGLVLANTAVSYFESGQPALLYIVPLTLGLVLYRSFKSETLRELWVQLPSMKTIAVPVETEEQHTMLARSTVVEALPPWALKENAHVVIVESASSHAATGSSGKSSRFDNSSNNSGISSRNNSNNDRNANMTVNDNNSTVFIDDNGNANTDNNNNNLSITATNSSSRSSRIAESTTNVQGGSPGTSGVVDAV